MGNNILKEITKNINNIIEIRKLAQEKQVDFKTAKILFNDGKKDIDIDTAKKIKEIADKYKISSNIIQSIILDDNKLDVEEFDIYDKIYDSNIIIQNEELKKIGIKYNYINEIQKLLKYGLSIEDADKLIQIKINAYAKIHHISKTAATLKIAYKFDKKEAQNYEEILDFFQKEGRNPDYILSENLREYLYSSDIFKKKEVNGIMIASKTEEGLSKLENIINEAFQKGKEDYIKELETASNKERLIISDYGYGARSCYYPTSALIHIKTNEKELLDTFFHETSHFLDKVNSYDKDKAFSKMEPKVREIFEKIKTEVNNNSVNSIINNKNIPLSIRKIIQKVSSKIDIGIYSKGIKALLPKIELGEDGIKYISPENKLANEYIKDERLNQKWKDEIEKKYSSYTKEDKELFYRQKLNYEKQKYLTLIGDIFDIYDGISKGNLQTYFLTTGHGKSYYSEENNDLLEFVAEIGAIYNSDGEDVLEFEFGKELTTEIINIYKEMIKNKKENNTENIIQTTEVINENTNSQEINNEISASTNKRKIAILRNIKKHLSSLSTNEIKGSHKR